MQVSCAWKRDSGAQSHADGQVYGKMLAVSATLYYTAFCLQVLLQTQQKEFSADHADRFYVDLAVCRGAGAHQQLSTIVILGQSVQRAQ